MRKADIVNMLFEKSGLPKNDAQEIVEAPAAGQAVVRRGEGKALCDESRLSKSESIPASESSVKRQRPYARGQSTTGGEPTVEGKT